MYLFYVDESGTPAPAKKPLPEGMSDVFVLVAASMFDGKWKGFNYSVRKHKETLYEKSAPFPAARLEIKDYEIKSNWIRRPKEREKSAFLKTLSEQGIEELVRKYYEQLKYHKMALIGVVIDKARLPAHYDSPKIHRKAWELLCERIEKFMRESHHRHKALIIADDCGLQANYSLASKHAYYLRAQTSANVRFRHLIETPLFTRSELSEGIQLADLCAYSIYRAFSRGDQNYPYFQEIMPHFVRSANTPDDKIDGLKVFP